MAASFLPPNFLIEGMDPEAAGLDNIAWYPDSKVRARSRLGAFLKFCDLASCEELYKRSIDNIAWFTGRLLAFLQIRFDTAYKRILDVSKGFPWARWCVGGGLPRTRNSKVLRRMIRSAYLGEDLGDVSVLENPEAIAAIREAGARTGSTGVPLAGLCE